MQVFFLYALVVLIWGSTWAAIPYQLGDVAAELSVAYRFGIAALAIYAYALLSGRQLRLPLDRLPMVFLQGTLLFSLPYFLVYYGTAKITSGLVAVLFSTIIISNAIFEHLLFKTYIDARLAVASALGMTGIVMIFWPEVAEISLEDETIVGILLILAATILASLGNMAAVLNNKLRALPVMAVNAHSMAWSAVLSFLIALLVGRPVNFSLEQGYVISLAYLAVFGSAIAFGAYLALLRRIGAARAAYSSVLFPVVALGISTLIEGYRWTAVAGVGIMLTLAGNWLILSRRKTTIENTEGTNS